ncbi:MAG: oligosaccharide flippase family protein [Actinobacteria bacterium]|nr:oligosaccharide flippase family protein [Actinomycetota bacterium]
MRLIKSVSISLIAKLAGFLIAIPTSIIIARYLGPSGRGIFAVLAVITGIALQFGNFGFHASSVYFSAKDKNQIPSIAGVLIIFGLTIGLFASLGIILISLLFPKVLLGDIPFLFLVVTLISLPFAFTALFLQNLLLGMQRIYEYNFIDVAAKLLTLLMIIPLFLVFKKGIFELVIMSTLIAILTGTAFAFFVKKHGSILLRFDYSLFKRMIRYGSKAYIAALFAFLVIRSDLILVNYFLGTGSAGLYSLAVGFTDWLLLVPFTMAAMLFPKATAIGDSKSELTKKVSRHTVVLVGIACMVAAIFAKPVVPFVYGKAFTLSADAFLWLLPGVFFLSLQTIFMHDFAARGMPPIVYISPAIGFIVNFSLNLILIPKFGIIAASMTSSLAYFLMFLITLIYFRYISDARYSEVLLLNREEIAEFWQTWRDKILMVRAG